MRKRFAQNHMLVKYRNIPGGIIYLTGRLWQSERDVTGLTGSLFLSSVVSSGRG
jgi:hypothetical protein